MDEKITTSAAENAENTAQAEQAAAPAQSSTQDGTRQRKLLRSPNRRLSRKPNLPEIQKQERLTAENQAAQNPPAKTTTLRRKTSRR